MGEKRQRIYTPVRAPLASGSGRAEGATRECALRQSCCRRRCRRCRPCSRGAARAVPASASIASEFVLLHQQSKYTEQQVLLSPPMLLRCMLLHQQHRQRQQQLLLRCQYLSKCCTRSMGGDSSSGVSICTVLPVRQADRVPGAADAGLSACTLRLY